jgi:hypothetical protein
MTTSGRIAAFVTVAALANFSAAAQVPIPVDEIGKTHQETKAALDPSLPKRIDASTVLTGVRIDGKTLFYQIRADYDQADITPELKDALGKKARAMICGDARSFKVLNFGGHYGFEYTDKFNQEIWRVTLSRSDCF